MWQPKANFSKESQPFLTGVWFLQDPCLALLQAGTVCQWGTWYKLGPIGVLPSFTAKKNQQTFPRWEELVQPFLQSAPVFVCTLQSMFIFCAHPLLMRFVCSSFKYMFLLQEWKTLKKNVKRCCHTETVWSICVTRIIRYVRNCFPMHYHAFRYLTELQQFRCSLRVWTCTPRTLNVMNFE